MDRKMVRWRGNGEETSPPHHFQLTLLSSLPPYLPILFTMLVYIFINLTGKKIYQSHVIWLKRNWGVRRYTGDLYG